MPDRRRAHLASMRAAAEVEGGQGCGLEDDVEIEEDERQGQRDDLGVGHPGEQVHGDGIVFVGPGGRPARQRRPRLRYRRRRGVVAPPAR